MDCFAEPVIGPRVRADPLARNDDGSRRTKKPAVIRDGGFLWARNIAGALSGRGTFQIVR